MTTNSPIYLDNNANTSVDPAIAQRMHRHFLEHYANPASQHAAGRRALRLMEDAKTLLMQLVGASTNSSASHNVIITSGGTESNNLAIRGLTEMSDGFPIVSAVEHPSVLDAARLYSKHRVLPVDGSGQCRTDILCDWIAAIYQAGERVSVVAVMLGNNETGVLQDLSEISQICRRYSIPLHCDATQAVGRIPLDMINIGIDSLAFTAHKIHGPVGVGALVVRPGLDLQPLLVGGGQQLALRPGTEPVVLADALAQSVSFTCQARDEGLYARVARFRDLFEHRITSRLDAVVVAGDTLRLPQTSNIAFPALDRQALHMALDLSGIACSTGSACASGSSLPSPVLLAMGLPHEVVMSSLRFSFSRFNTEQETITAADTIVSVADKLQSKIQV